MLGHFQNCKAYLESFPENELVLRKIRQYVEQFVGSYYIVKGCVQLPSLVFVSPDVVVLF